MNTSKGRVAMAIINCKNTPKTNNTKSMPVTANHSFSLNEEDETIRPIYDDCGLVQ